MQVDHGGGAPSRGAPSRWRPDRPRLVRLLVGLVLFGTGRGCLVDASIGVSPWTVLGQGVSAQAGIPVGTATILLSFVVLAFWLPLRQAPGLGTIANAVVVGLTIDVVLTVLPGPRTPPLQLVEVLIGVAMVAIGSGLYLTTQLGPGPRDGLMTGLHRLTGRSVRVVRFALEASVCVLGVLLGGSFGVGTVLFAVLIGPAVQLVLEGLGFKGRTDAL